MAKMTDDALLKHLKSNEDDGAQYVDAIGSSRLASMREYHREAYPGDEELDGWSQIVTSEVQDTVEWILPELLDVFTTSDEAVAVAAHAEEAFLALVQHRQHLFGGVAFGQVVAGAVVQNIPQQK